MTFSRQAEAYQIRRADKSSTAKRRIEERRAIDSERRDIGVRAREP